MGVPSKSSFFKFILDPHVQASSTGLRIPTKFMRNHGKNLSNRVFLKVPGGGRLWQVEMTTNPKNGEVWLNKGWREFAEHYSIVHKTCLLFTYEGSSTFLVIIFDSSASEIEYPTSGERGVEIESEDDHESNQCRKKMKHSSCHEELNQNGGSSTDTDTSTGTNAAVSADTEEDSEDEDDKSGFRIKRKRQASEKEMANALQLAKAFKPGNPFFLVRMQPSYVRGNYSNNLPQRFVQRYMNKRHSNVVLQITSKGRTWLAKYMVYNNRNAKLSAAGWKKFVNDNSMTIGDVCVFELIDGVENLFEVHVFRAIDEKSVGPDLPNEKRKSCRVDTMDSTSYTTDEVSQEEDDKNFWIERKQQPSEIEKANALRLAKAFRPDKPFYLVTLQPSYVNGKTGVNVPLRFLQRYLNKRHNNFVLQVISKGRTWKAKYMVYATNGYLDAAGWKAFVHDNSLIAGDVCVFELIDGVKNLLKVHIFRAMQNKVVPRFPIAKEAKAMHSAKTF